MIVIPLSHFVISGLVSWEEYLEYFFRAHDIHGISADDIRNLTPAFRSLPQDAKGW
jgi:hypothetical protein